MLHKIACSASDVLSSANATVCIDNNPENADGTMPLADYVTLFSTGLFCERFSLDYLLRLAHFPPEWMMTLVRLGKTGALVRLRGG